MEIHKYLIRLLRQSLKSLAKQSVIIISTDKINNSISHESFSSDVFRIWIKFSICIINLNLFWTKQGVCT